MSVQRQEPGQAHRNSERALRGLGGEVPAATDAASDDYGRRPLGRSSWPVLLTIAVLTLIYQQVLPPFGATVVKTWLHYALPVLGDLLLTQSMRYGAKITWSQIRRAARQIQKLAKGFSVTFDPYRTENDLDEEGDKADSDGHGRRRRRL
jgi:hypothetical protein